jgi:hypothetical protein
MQRSPSGLSGRYFSKGAPCRRWQLRQSSGCPFRGSLVFSPIGCEALLGDVASVAQLQDGLAQVSRVMGPVEAVAFGAVQALVGHELEALRVPPAVTFSVWQVRQRGFVLSSGRASSFPPWG